MKLLRDVLRALWRMAVLIAAPVGLMHELCHFVPAWLFGLKPVLRIDRVGVFGGTRSQLFITISAPTIIGALIAGTCYAGLVAAGPDRLAQLAWRLAASAGLCMVIGSIKDWRDLIALFRENTQ